MNRTFAMGTLLFLLIGGCYQKKSAPPEEWIQLFNGKDLTNWTAKIHVPRERRFFITGNYMRIIASTQLLKLMKPMSG